MAELKKMDKMRKRKDLPGNFTKYAVVTSTKDVRLNVTKIFHMNHVLTHLFAEPLFQNAVMLVQERITFRQWCAYFHRLEKLQSTNTNSSKNQAARCQCVVDEDDVLPIVAHMRGLNFFPSHEMLSFMCDLFQKIMPMVNCHQILSLVTCTSALTEACLIANGLSLQCYCMFSPTSPCNDEEGLFVDCEKHVIVSAKSIETKIVYAEFNHLMETSNNIFELVSIKRPNVLFLVGPCAHLGEIAKLNQALIEDLKYKRHIFHLQAISMFHRGYDAFRPSTCLIAYYNSNNIELDAHFTQEKQLVSCAMTSPTHALRFHFLQHILNGELRDYWQPVIHFVPLKELLLRIYLLPCCQQLIEMFATNGFQETETEDFSSLFSIN